MTNNYAEEQTILFSDADEDWIDVHIFILDMFDMLGTDLGIMADMICDMLERVDYFRGVGNE